MSQKQKKPHSPILVDLDKLAEDSGVIIKMNGAEHRMKLVSVRDYIANIKRVEEFKKNGSVQDEMDFIVQTLAQAFPTLTETEFYELSLPQLQAIYQAFENYAQDGARDPDAKAPEQDPQPASE